MQNLKTTTETTSSYFSKEDLKTLLMSKQDKIKKLVSEVKHCVEPLYEVSIQLVAILRLRTCPHHP